MQRKNRQAGTSSKRSLEVDDDGDVVMAGERKERGGSKRTRKRKRRAPYGTEVELMDVEVGISFDVFICQFAECNELYLRRNTPQQLCELQRILIKNFGSQACIQYLTSMKLHSIQV